MKVQPIQSVQHINFESKQRFVSDEAKSGIQNIIARMRENTTYSDNGYYFKAVIFKELSDINGKVKFQDGRIYLGNQLPKKIMNGETLLTIDKTKLVIDNQAGEIKDHYKPFFVTWKQIMRKIDKYVEFFQKNFNSEELVKHKSLSMSGFTEKGLEKFQKLKDGLSD